MAIEILDPTWSPPPASGERLRARPATLDDLVIGLLDNGKRNSDKVLDLVAEAIARRYRVKEFVRRRKHSSSTGLAPELARELARECQAVIAGVGD